MRFVRSPGSPSASTTMQSPGRFVVALAMAYFTPTLAEAQRRDEPVIQAIAPAGGTVWELATRSPGSNESMATAASLQPICDRGSVYIVLGNTAGGAAGGWMMGAVVSMVSAFDDGERTKRILHRSLLLGTAAGLSVGLILSARHCSQHEPPFFRGIPTRVVGRVVAILR